MYVRTERICEMKIRTKMLLKTKLVIGTTCLFLVGALGMYLIVDSVIKEILYQGLVTIAQNEKQMLADKIDEWFRASQVRVEHLTAFFQTLESPEEFQRALTTLVDEMEVDDIFIGLDDGRMINGSGWLPEGSWDSTTRPWYRAARETNPGEVASTSPYLSLASGNVSLAFSTYLPDVLGIGGVVGTAIPLSDLQQLITSEAILEGGFLVIINQNREIILHPDGIGWREDGSLYSLEEIYGGTLEELEAEWNNGPVDSRVSEDASVYVMTTNLKNSDLILLAVVPVERIHDQSFYYIMIISISLASVLILLYLVMSVFLHLATLDLEEKRVMEERFKAMLNASPWAVAIGDEKLNFTQLNKKGMALFGVVAEEGENVTLNALTLSPPLQPDGQTSTEKAKQILAQVQAQGWVRFEWMHHTLGQIPLPCDITLVKTHLDGKKQLIIYIRDLTEEKEVLTLLQEAVEKAESANETKSSFFANLSHEMRTPMNAIIGMTEIGKRASEASGKDDALNRISVASNHLLGIINDVLDMSKIESGMFELSNESFDFRAVVKKTVDIIEEAAYQKNLILDVKFAPDIPKCLYGDAQKLAQVIANLLTNSVKFTSEGGSVSLKSSLISRTDKECQIRVDVRDTGIGIEKETCALLFENFHQSDRTVSRKFGGTGLGLSICKKIVDLFEGRIWVESEVGVGSVFSFEVTLPISGTDEDGCRGKNSRPPIVAPAVENPQEYRWENVFSGKRILLAEDIQINQEIVISLLEETGVEIVCAGDGSEAVELYLRGAGSFDLILMDLHMPGMDGLEATRQIRSFDTHHVPIIALTADVFVKNAQKCLEAGMDDYLSKPLDIHIVREKLRLYLNRSTN